MFWYSPYILLIFPPVKYFLLLLVFIFSLPAFAQVDFEKKFGGGLHENALDILQSSDGNYVVLFNEETPGNIDTTRFTLLKLDTSGDTMWVKTFSNTGSWEGGLGSSRPGVH